MSFAGSARFRLMTIGFVFAVGGCGILSPCDAQEMQHDHMPAAGPKASAGVLTIASGDKSIPLVPDALKAMPHTTITVHNGHTKMDETYSGVLLSDLLAKVDAPLGAKLHGKALASYVLVAGSDGYQAIYSIAEIDPSFHSGDVIVADTLNGKPLADDGPFKIVNTEDKRPARWVRNTVSIKLVTP